MASVSTIPVCISVLYEELYCEIGGPFHPRLAEHYNQYPELKLPESGDRLKNWMKRQLRNQTQTGQLDIDFAAAIQTWATEKIKELNDHKARYLELFQFADDRNMSGDKKHLWLNETLVHMDSGGWAQPPVFKEDQDNKDFVLVDDGGDTQSTILQEWKQQPTLILEMLPQVKAAFDYLKNRQNP